MPSTATPSKKSKLHPPLAVAYTKRFHKDWANIRAAGKPDLSGAQAVMLHLIANQSPLAASHVDHPLSGNYAGHRTCHVYGDLVIIYMRDDRLITFVRIGSHAAVYEN